MEKRGIKPKGKIDIHWSPNFAYAIGLLVTDGCLSNSGRHISFVSKDTDQINNFLKALKINNIKIGQSYSMSSGEKKFYNRVQFGDVLFYRFLQDIGLTPAKSKTMGEINVPNDFFFDFLRGCFDGDGCSYSYWDKRWKSSFMLYIIFVSASEKYVAWLRNKIFEQLGIKGHVTTAVRKGNWYQLKYAKNDSLILINAMYKNSRVIHLKRKKLKIDQSLAII